MPKVTESPSVMLFEYHRRIGEIFLAPEQTPSRVNKKLWHLHAEMAHRISIVLASEAESKAQKKGFLPERDCP